MTGIPIKRQNGPVTYTALEPIVGGQLVEGRDPVSGVMGVGVAGAGSLRVVGVAIRDAVPAASVVTNTTIAGTNALVAVPQPTNVPVAYGNDEVPVTYAADAHFGDLLVAAAAGKVTPAGSSADPRTIVGRCVEPGGVTVSVKAVGRTRIF